MAYSYYAPEIFLDEEAQVRRGHRSRRRDTSSSSGGTFYSDASVFSHSSYSSSSTMPSHTVQLLRNDPRPQVSVNVPGQELVCELFQHGLCQETFSYDDFAGWKHHVVKDHLNGHLPKISGCCFCCAVHHARSMTPERLQSSFKSRMKHIEEHFRQGQTREHMKPDPYLYQHLCHIGIIDPPQPSQYEPYSQTWQQYS